MDRGVRLDVAQVGPAIRAVAGLLEEFPPCRCTVVLARIDHPARDFEGHPLVAEAVLVHAHAPPIGGQSDHIDPIRSLEHEAFQDGAGTRILESVVAHLEQAQVHPPTFAASRPGAGHSRVVSGVAHRPKLTRTARGFQVVRPGFVQLARRSRAGDGLSSRPVSTSTPIPPAPGLAEETGLAEEPRALGPATSPVALGHVALLAVQFCFGLFPVFVKFALLGLSPRAIAAWRIGVGALVFLLLAFAISGRKAIPARGDLGLLCLLALLGVVGNQVLALEGFSRSTAMNAGLIMTLIPVFTFAIAAAFRQERFELRRAVGVPFGILGALLLMLQGGDTPELSRQYLIGNVLMASNCLCYAAYLVISRRLLERYDPLTMIAWVYGCSLWAVPFLGIGETLVPLEGPDQRTVWIGLVLVLVFPTVLAYLLNTFALSRVPASVTAIYIYLQPLIAGLGGILILGERFRPIMLPAALSMFASIWLVTRRSGGRERRR